ncbi:MAG: hypothetical protein GXX95_04710 [Methanomassiliicoccus sp.]|nr:hypothetical protein [Methanomassiliicoccus sp.]
MKGTDRSSQENARSKGYRIRGLLKRIARTCPVIEYFLNRRVRPSAGSILLIPTSNGTSIRLKSLHVPYQCINEVLVLGGQAENLRPQAVHVHAQGELLPIGETDLLEGCRPQELPSRPRCPPSFIISRVSDVVPSYRT